MDRGQPSVLSSLLNEVVGPGYLDGVLEPTVMAVEARMSVHASRGETVFAADDALAVRTAALAFLSPILVALLHQHALAGTKCRPLDIDAFLSLHVKRFVASYARKRVRRAPARS